MSESAALLISWVAMLLIAMLASGGLYMFGLSPLWVILGGTLVGMCAYVLFWSTSSRFVEEQVVMEEQQNG